MALVAKFAIISLLFGLIKSFNIDVNIPVLKFGRPDTYFGYSVAQHFIEENGINNPVILIGAPKEESDQNGTKKAGALFSCPVNTRKNGAGNSWCNKRRVEYLPPDADAIDPYSQAPKDVKDQIECKDNQWLGASVASAAVPKSMALVCAPYTLFESALYQFGVCYRLKNDLSPDAQGASACSTQLKVTGRHNDLGTCLEGISSVVSNKYGVVASGLPGAVDWVGGVHAVDLKDIFKRSRSTAHAYENTGSVETFISKNSYLGFSVGVGKFGFSHERSEHTRVASGQEPKHKKPAAVTTIVSGAPRFSNDTNTGAVFFFAYTHDGQTDLTRLRLMPDHYHLKGEILGSLFGYSLVVLDVNQDGFDDLIVGAPKLFNASQEEETSGAVYVYFSKGSQQLANEDPFYSPVKLLGPSSPDSDFGSSITSLGDVNKDGYFDFAVGAPFYSQGGKSNRSTGAVFIYNGAANVDEFVKNRLNPSQIIKSSDLEKLLPTSSLETFGWSLSGGADMDNNSYPDLLVGAFKSNTVVLLRSRPIISIAAEVEEVPTIDKDNQQCRNADACFEITTRVKFIKQAGHADSLALLDVSRNSLICKLEALSYKGAAQRAILRQNSAETDDKFVMEWECGRGIDQRDDVKRHAVVIKQNRDWLNPLLFKFSIHMPDINPPLPADGAPLPNINQFPVLDSRLREKDFKVEFDKKCGQDNKCESELLLTCALRGLARERPGSGIYVKQVGKDDFLNLTFFVRNDLERAYESSLYLWYNEHELEKPLLAVNSFGRLVNLGSYADGLVVIDLGNPLEELSNVTFDLNFKLIRGLSTGIASPLKFVAFANTIQKISDKGSNNCTVEVKVIKKAEIGITGKSEPSRVMYGGKILGESAMEYEEDVGPAVKHVYSLTNDGPWGVGNVSVLIDFPYEVESPYLQGKWALYLMELPISRIPVPGGKEIVKRCFVDDPVDRINPLNLKANNRYSLLQPSSSVPRVKRGIRDDNGVPAARYSTVARRSKRDYRIQSEIIREKSGEHIRRVVIGVCFKSCPLFTAKCLKIRCQFDYIDKDISPVIEIRSRLWNSTFTEDYPRDVDHVLIVSHARLYIDPHQGVEQNTTDDFAQARTMAQPDIPEIPRPTVIPIYIIIIAAAAGVFLLFLIVIVCWKIGFFERSSGPRQPVYVADFKPSLLSDNEDTAT